MRTIKNVKPLTRAQIAALLRSIGREQGEIGGIPAADFWTALHFIMWDAWTCISRTLSIRFAWIDLEERWLTLPAKNWGGGGSGHVYQLQPETIEAIERIRLPERPELFPATYRFKQSGIYPAYHVILKRAGIPFDGKPSHRMFDPFRFAALSFADAGGSMAWHASLSAT